MFRKCFDLNTEDDSEENKLWYKNEIISNSLAFIADITISGYFALIFIRTWICPLKISSIVVSFSVLLYFPIRFKIVLTSSSNLIDVSSSFIYDITNANKSKYSSYTISFANIFSLSFTMWFPITDITVDSL